MADLRLVTIPPPYNGMDTSSAPGKCPDGRAPLVRNFLVHTPGKLPVRGPVTSVIYEQNTINVALGESNAILTGAWKFHNKLLLGFVDKTFEGKITPWMDLYANERNVIQDLSKGKTSLVLVDLTSGSASKIATGSHTFAPSGNSARLEKYVYGYSYSATSAVEIWEGGPVAAKTGLMRWNGENTAPTQYTTGPKAAQAVKTHLNRLWVLGGTDPTAGETIPLGTGEVLVGGEGIYSLTIKVSNLNSEAVKYIRDGTSISWTKKAGGTKTDKIKGAVLNTFGPNPQWEISMESEYLTSETERSFNVVLPNNGLEANALYFTDQGGPTADNVNMWKDDVSGLVNKIIVGDDDKNDFGVGMGVVNQSLVIFKRNSIWALFGYSPSTFQIRNLTTERGCIDPFSIFEADGGVYFVSQDGLEFYDGSEFLRVDAPIENQTRSASQFHAGEEAVKNREANLGRTTMAYLGQNYMMIAIAGQDPDAGTLSTNQFAAYTHQGSGNWAQFTTDVLSGVGQPLYVGNNADLPWVFDGNRITSLRYVADPAGAQVAGLKLIDRVGFLGSTKKAIPAKYLTDRIQMNSPGYMSQWHRFLFDYRFPNGTSDSTAVKGWFIKLIKEDSSEVLAETQVGGHAEAANTKYLFGRRFESDLFGEAIDGQLSVEWKTDTTEIGPIEAYDATVELEVTRQRRSV